MDAALAARCANEQGEFWKMHDKLFDNQNFWSSSFTHKSVFVRYANDLGLDEDSFNSCLQNSNTYSQVTKDLNEGQSAGISGTPGVFILLPKSKTDLKKVNGVVSGYSQYMKIFEDENNYIVRITGAFPYTAYNQILEAVDY
jgi:protein-disulfide isomerase